MKKILIFLVMCISFVCGILWQTFQDQKVIAQTFSDLAAKRIIIKSSGAATSSKKPEEAELFRITTEDKPLNSLSTVPKGKKLVITDMMFDARYAEQDLVINLNQRIEDKESLSYKKHHSLQQISIKAGESKDIHLCTGYVIQSDNGIVAWTNAGLKPKQLVLMNFTGYLVDENAEN